MVMIFHSLGWRKSKYRWTYYGLPYKLFWLSLLLLGVVGITVAFIPSLALPAFLLVSIHQVFQITRWTPYIRKMDYLHDSEMVKIEVRYLLERK